VRVRQALAHAIDRGFIRNNIFPGVSEDQVGPLPASFALANKSLTDYALDPARANALLDQAGFPRATGGNRFKFRLLWSGSDERQSRMADVITQGLKAVGIETVPTPLDVSSLNQIGYVKGEFDMLINSYALGPDPDVGTERLYNTRTIRPAPFVNNSGYSNPELDKLFDQQRGLADFAGRKAIYDKIQEIVWRDIPVLPLCNYNIPTLSQTSRFTGGFDGYNLYFDDFSKAVPA
jgi:peptide/nickel transport system substrate-binding protein